MKPGWLWGPLLLNVPMMSDGRGYRMTGVRLLGVFLGTVTPEPARPRIMTVDFNDSAPIKHG
jgi:hypothetical protein